MHVAAMLDLETLATTEWAVVTEAAVVIVDLMDHSLDANDAPKPLFEQQWYFNIEEQGTRQISPATLRWRAAMTPMFLVEMDTKPITPYRDFLVTLSNLMQVHNVDTVWSKGADFDIPIVANMCKTSGLSIPWNFRQIRCFRTIEASIKNLADWGPGLPEERLFSEPEHSALGDARFQMRTLCHIVRNL